MQTFWQDIRFGLRLLVKDRWVTLAAITALGLGIGATNTVFTLVNAVLLRPLPFEKPDRMMWLGTRDARGREFGVSLRDFEDWRAANPKSFTGLALMSSVPLNVSGDDAVPNQYAGAYLSATAFPMIGEQAVVGRTFGQDDDRPGAPPVVILGSEIWHTRYGSDPAVVGRTIKVSGLPATVIGVMRDGMKFPFNNELWLPLAQQPPVIRAEPRQIRARPVIGRLADGATIEQARAEFAGIAAQLERAYPDTNKGWVPTIKPYAEQETGGQIRLLFWSLIGAVGFVLLVACANVANLLLMRAAHRSREVSVRVALGATRGRIVRQLLVESVLLALLSGGVGLVLSIAGIQWFDAATTGVGRPYWVAFTMDVQVAGFLLALCLATAVVFGLAPALHLSKTNVHEVLKEGGRLGSGGMRARRWTSALIVAELTMTLVLLAGAGLMARSFLAQYTHDTGIDTSKLLTMQIRMAARDYPTPESRTTLLRRLDERLANIGSIQAASTTSNLPLQYGIPRQLDVEGRVGVTGETKPVATLLSVGTRYFDTLGLKLLRGRTFTDSDGAPGHESAIVNLRLVAMHFPNEDPIGKRIRVSDELQAAAQPLWLTIVGVAPTVRQRSVQDIDPDPVVYVPHFGNPYLTRDSMLVVRTQGDPGKTVALLREEVRAVDPDMPLFNIRTMDEALAQMRWGARTFGTMFAAFAMIALLLSAVGLYAVTAYSVTQRTQEIGIRMALGAQPRQVSWLILRRGLIQLAVGLAAGLAGALSAGRVLQSLLVQTNPRDPVTMLTVVGVLIVVSAAACLGPARRATRLDPNLALRYE